VIRKALTGVGRHLRVWRMTLSHHKQQKDRPRPDGLAVEFLPAVLEIQETPPSPLGRKLVYLIITLFMVAITWATFGQIDIITMAQGKIIPGDYSKVIQPLEAGVVSAIHVRDGQYVTKGDVLLELDPSSPAADQGRLNNERTSAMVSACRLRALLDGKDHYTTPEGAAADIAELQQTLLRDQRAEVENKLQSAKRQIDQRRATLNVTESNIKRLEGTLPLISQRVKALKSLLEKDFVSKSDYLALEEERVNQQQELAMELFKRVEQQAALDDAIKQPESIMIEYRNAWQSELSKIETDIKSLAKEEAKASVRTSQQTLTAPIDGVVQQLSVHTIGGVVTPAQQLMIIAPREGQLEIEAWIENKDIGFVNEGQSAEIKVEAFPFTKYGVIDGELLHVSHDAIPLDKVGYVYSARVDMEQTSIDVGDKQIKLSPGMNVAVEVRTGQRRVIEYFLNPILRGFKETARER
jgi:hemolysin D